MEFFTLLLSSLLTLISPAGIALDTVAQQEFRDRLYAAEQLQIRIDNTPSYQLVRGEVDRVRIAGRGLYLMPEVRIDTLEVETDAIAVDPNQLEINADDTLIRGLRQPLQAGVRLVLTEADINRSLRSPEFYSDLQNLALTVFDSPLLQQLAGRYTLVNSQVEFLESNRVRFETQIQERGYDDRLTLTIETGLNFSGGKQLQLISPEVLVNGKPAPRQLLRGLEDLATRFNLEKLETRGVRSRFLQLNLTGDRAQMTLFVRVE